MVLDFIVPAYQEQENLEEAVRSILHAAGDRPVRVTLVDDGSSDATPRIADGLASRFPCVKVVHQTNQGIGGALRTGFAHALGDYAVIWPADMRLDPAVFRRICAMLGDADVLVGYRRTRPGYSLGMRLNSRIYLGMARWICGLPFRDVTWISVYRLSILRGMAIRENGVAVFPEILLKARQAGAKFAEIELEMQERVHGVPSASRWRTRVRALTGLLGLCVRYHRFKVRRS